MSLPLCAHLCRNAEIANLFRFALEQRRRRIGVRRDDVMARNDRICHDDVVRIPRSRTIAREDADRVDDVQRRLDDRAQVGDTLVEIQGQMEQHGLLDMATHRASLDAFAMLEKQGETVRAAWHAWRLAEQACADAETATAAARRDEDFLRHAMKELEALSPKADDEDKLAGERQLLRAGSALGEAVTQALAELGTLTGGAVAA